MKRVTRPVAVPVLVLTLLGLGTPPAAAEPSPVFPVAFITLSTLQLYPQEALGRWSSPAQTWFAPRCPKPHSTRLSA